MDAADDLPIPRSNELERLVPNAAARVVYEVLYEHREHGLTMQELRTLAAPRLAEAGLADQQEQLDRRKRDLHSHFVVEKSRRGKQVVHRLASRRDAELVSRRAISGRIRAIVLQPGRCAICGRTPVEDGVKLVVDHKIPLDWGGTNDLENLQPLCEECNSGKKSHFASFAPDISAIRTATSFSETHKRIGELLKALKGVDVRSDLIGTVASVGAYQEDWQKRLRELRELGWLITTIRRREEGRVWSYYRLEHWEPWPQGSVRAEISRRERAKKTGQPPTRTKRD